MGRVDFGKVDEAASKATAGVQSKSRQEGLKIEVGRRKKLADQRSIEEDQRVIATRRAAEQTSKMASNPAARKKINDFVRLESNSDSHRAEVAQVAPPDSEMAGAKEVNLVKSPTPTEDFDRGLSLDKTIGVLEEDYLLGGLESADSGRPVDLNMEEASSASEDNSRDGLADKPRLKPRLRSESGSKSSSSSMGGSNKLDSRPDDKLGDLSLGEEKNLDRAISKDTGYEPVSYESIENDIVEDEISLVASRDDFGGIHRVYGQGFSGEHFAKVSDPKIYAGVGSKIEGRRPEQEGRRNSQRAWIIALEITLALVLIGGLATTFIFIGF